MGIDPSILPDNAPVIPMALSVALAVVNPNLCAAGYAPGVTGTNPVSIYTLAVYNLAGDNLVNYAPDTSNLPSPNNTYFAKLRKDLNISAWVSGVVASSYDEGSGQTLVVQEAAKNFTISNLQNLKTPWGRTYLGFAQAYGPSVVGIS